MSDTPKSSARDAMITNIAAGTMVDANSSIGRTLARVPRPRPNAVRTPLVHRARRARLRPSRGPS